MSYIKALFYIILTWAFAIGAAYLKYITDRTDEYIWLFVPTFMLIIVFAITSFLFAAFHFGAAIDGD